MLPVHERQHIFIGSHAAWDHFRREQSQAVNFHHAIHPQGLRGRLIGLVVVAAHPLTQIQHTMVEDCHRWHPECRVVQYHKDLFGPYGGIVDTFAVPVGTVACMWCGEEVVESAIDRHEGVCCVAVDA